MGQMGPDVGALEAAMPAERVAHYMSLYAALLANFAAQAR
jgi:hypothetical protein